jgi:hypothetical protein
MNPHRGDVALHAGDKAYTLRYSHLALVKLEQKLDKGLVQIAAEMSRTVDMRLRTVVVLLWAGLQKHHPEVTEEDAAEILDEIDGGAASAMGAIDAAFSKRGAAPGRRVQTLPRGREWSWDDLVIEYASYGFDPETFWDITPRELKLLSEATARRFEREHNARAWLAWHIAALQRMKKLPDLKRMTMKNTSRPRQTWRQQLAIMTEWAAKHNLREAADGG